MPKRDIPLRRKFGLKARRAHPVGDFRAHLLALINESRKWRRGPRRNKGGAAMPEPVEPNRPNTLSGGAAAELEFDD